MEISFYTYMHTVNEDHMIYGSWNIRWNRQNFLSFWTIFCPFIPQQPGKWKFWKLEKNNWRYCHFTQVHHKWQSYDIWFLRYGAWQKKLFVILVGFLPFYLPVIVCRGVWTCHHRASIPPLKMKLFWPPPHMVNPP